MFRELKKRFTKELVLAALDLDKNIRIDVDALDYAMGGVWFYLWNMKIEDGDW